jgi:hypothetical protein
LSSERRPSDAELKRERDEGLKRIQAANVDLMERVVQLGVRFQLDDDDALRITIGSAPSTFYTQRIGQVRINLDRTSDQVVGFVIDRIEDYLRDHPDTTTGFHNLLPVLRQLKVLQVPPETPTTESLRKDFRELIPA